MHRLLKYNLVLIFTLVFLTVNAFAKEDKVTNVKCSGYLQKTKKDAAWKCPPIDTALEQQLDDIDLTNGNYVCTYRYKDTGAIASTCEYKSSYYADAIRKKLEEVANKVKKYEKIEFDKVNIFDFIDDDNIRIAYLENLVNNTIAELKKYFDDASGKNLSSISDTLKKTNQIIKTHLIYPYTKNDPNLPPKDVNLASFIVGLVTIDPSIVKGYNVDTGKLEINNDFKTRASEIVVKDDKLDKEVGGFWNLLGKTFRYLFGTASKSEADAENYAEADKYNVSSWIDVFKMKLWGWYYQFNSYYDIGYDVLSTQLLFITMAFFAMVMSIRGGVRYISNREMGNSSGEIKLGEEQLVKTLGVLAIIGFFFISVPSTNKDPNTGEPMRKNLTLAKTFIRYSLQEGNYYATMFADLGSASFLDYIVKKQGLFTGMELKNRMAQSVAQIVQYYPSEYITNECLAYYNTNKENLLASIDVNELTVKPNYTSTFFSKNNITGLNYNLCKNMLKHAIIIPKEIAFDVLETSELTKNANVKLAQATNLIIRNHILLEDKLGWYSIGSVPFTYFMMKNNNMFVDNSINYEEIEAKAQEYVSNTVAHGSKDNGNKNVPFEKNKWAQIENGAGFAVAYATSAISKYGLYNLLPGFSNIRESINSYLDKTYRDLLLDGEKKSDSDKKSILKNLVDKLSKVSENENESAKLHKFTAKVGKFFSNPLVVHTIFVILSYLAAIGIWKMGFSVIFISSIITLILFKIVMYSLMVLKHFIVSLFMVAWAFASGNNGMIKTKNFIRETIIVAIYPSIVVLGVFVFIFSYELFQVLYTLVVNILIEGQIRLVDIMGGTKSSIDSFSSYFTLDIFRYFIEIMIDIFSFFIAIATIYKFPENALNMMGLRDSVAVDMSKQAQEVASKGEKNVNPLA